MNRLDRVEDDGRPSELDALVRGGSRRPAMVGIVVVAIVLLAIVKPWNWGLSPAPAAAPAAGRASAPATTSRPTPEVTSDVLAPMVTPAPTGEGLLQCLRFDAWRLLTISRAHDQLVRTWTAMTPRRAGGPDEISDFLRVADGSVVDVGYCGPVALLPGNPASVTVSAWRKDAVADAAVPLGRLEPAFPSAAASRALFVRPPSIGGPNDEWPAGLYVFHLVAGRPSPLDVWFGVEIA